MSAAVGFVVPVLYLASAVLFILGLKRLCRVRSARGGLALVGFAFLLALLGVAVETGRLNPLPALVGLAAGIVVGLVIGYGTKVELGPGLGPLLASAGGVASAALVVAAFATDETWPSASIFALDGGARGAALGLGFVAGIAALGLGVLAAVGSAARGAGQPAVVALAASTSGLASAMVGLALGNPIVATVGGLVAAAGYSLAGIVGTALGRKPLDIAFGRGRGSEEYNNVKACGVEEAAMELETARKVIVVPGYGMAVAQAQHALADVAKVLAANGAKVLYAIHPAAGLIPGHMNILLDEAKVDEAQLREWEDANRELADADVALVVGACDIVNPAAKDDRSSALFGMPVIEVEKARTVFVIKRSLRPGASGAKNPLFERPNVTLVFGDAKKVLQGIGVELKAQIKAAA